MSTHVSRTPHASVIPAKAGIQTLLYSEFRFSLARSFLRFLTAFAISTSPLRYQREQARIPASVRLAEAMAKRAGMTKKNKDKRKSRKGKDLHVSILQSALRCIVLLAFISVTMQAHALSTEETTTKVKTTKFFIFQKPSVLVSPTSETTSFTIFIGEQNPVIKDAYIELRGVSKVTASQSLTVDINQSDSFPTSREQQFTLDASGSPRYFRFLYTGTPAQTLTSYFASSITAPGTFTFFLKTAISGADVSLLQARLIITYAFMPPSSGGFPATGNVVSSTFDTTTSNGAAFNSIVWKGTKPAGTRVRLQFATSNSASGPFTFIGGASCTASDYYEPNADSPSAIGCFPAHNNKRYFRYKVILCSSTDCATSGSQTPQVDDVIVNWSP